MTSKALIGYTDGDYAERASILADAVAAEAAIAAAQAAAVQVYARAAAHAERVTRSKAAREREMALRSMAAEIGCATRIPDRTVQRRIDNAESLVSRYPKTMAAWAEGRISQGHVRAVADAGMPLDAGDQALFDDAAVAVCEAETATAAKHLLAMLAEKLNPRTLTERHQDARDLRAVRVGVLADGMAELVVILPLALAHAIHDRLTRQGRVIKDVRERARREVADAARAEAAGGAADAGAAGSSDHAGSGDAESGDAGSGDAESGDAGSGDAGSGDAGAGGADGAGARETDAADGVGEAEASGTAAAGETEADAHAREHAEVIASDERTLDHIRADILADMLLTGCPDSDPTVTGDKPGELGAIRAHVQVVVPVLVAAGVTDDPAELVGRGPIDAETARRLVGDSSGFDRVMTHPITGAVLAVDRYTPTAAMDRFLQARDIRCRFPGCWMPAIRCDLDHTHDYARGGKTERCNLAHLCKRHHPLKHVTPWQVVQLPGGILEWTSPLGLTYTDQPPAVGPINVAGAGAFGGAKSTSSAGVRFVPDDDTAPF